MSRHELWGELLSLLQYRGTSNADVLREFAEDVIAGHYAHHIVYNVSTYMPDEESTYLDVLRGAW